MSSNSKIVNPFIGQILFFIAFLWTITHSYLSQFKTIPALLVLRLSNKSLGKTNHFQNLWLFTNPLFLTLFHPLVLGTRIPSWELYIITFVLLFCNLIPLSLYISYWLFSGLWVNFVLDLSCIIKVWRNKGSRQLLTLSSFSVFRRWREPPVQRACYSQDRLFLITEQGKGINAQIFQFNVGKQFSKKKIPARLPLAW